MNKINMLKSVYFLYTQVPKEQFHMAWWRNNYKDKKADFKNPICNTSACVGGWLTSIVPEKKILTILDGTILDGTIDFSNTIRSMLGLSDKQMQFLTAMRWHNIDNTLEGACKRFLYLLETKDPYYGITSIHPYTKIDIVSTYNRLKAKYEKSWKLQTRS